MKKFVRLTILFLAATPVALFFQNCGQPGQISAIESQKSFAIDPITLISSPSIVIDGGAEFTNFKNVMLQLDALGAEEMIVSDTPNCESSAGWERYSQTKPWILSDVNKSTKVYVKYRKKGAPETACLFDDILHDDIAPQLSGLRLPSGFTKELSVQLVYSVVENGSGIKELICRDHLNQDENCIETYNFKGLDQEGLKSVLVSATDKAGNKSTPLMISLVVDRTAPVITINGPKGIMALSAANFKITIAEANNLKSVQCRLLPNEPNYSDCKSLVANLFTHGRFHLGGCDLGIV